MLGFYSTIVQTIPNLAVVIRKILSNQVATSTAERTFNISGNVLSIRRCSLDPIRAEKLIKSAFRHRSCKHRCDKKPPGIPSFRILEDEDVEEAEDEDNVRERQEIETVAWAAFFDDD